jgi:hypothetical protein
MALGKVFAECPTKSTRQRCCCRCTVRRAFFAECKIAFAVCLEHTAKELIPVVMVLYWLRLWAQLEKDEEDIIKEACWCLVWRRRLFEFSLTLAGDL